MNRDRMTDPYDISSSSSTRSMLPSFLIGAAAGAAVALLFAPSSGRTSRAWLKDGARKLRDGAEDTMDHAKGALEDGKTAVRDAISSGKNTMHDTASAARDGFNKSREEATASAGYNKPAITNKV